ncbi:LRR domain containing protein [Parasponia andersonii]|uniref:LRR domain containing protein n=1 Tax=Parasponia andersonii TaxID=3476 RepID=A0A2P5C3J3_PARAD|nr:LRR domain containing protein [Parasponia andersonii]
MQLGDLNKLKYLRGYLSIHGIGNVQDAGDAEKAKLLNKQNLTCLKLNFSQDSGVRTTEDKSAVLLEALRPPLNLLYLQITRYRGVTFPKWMVSLVNLRVLILNRCHNCSSLPPLGKLPFLRALRINYADKVEIVGLEFLGVETGSNTTELESFSVSFPKLEELRFVGLSSWKQWLGVRYTTSSLKIMPSLRFLEISNCEMLEALPEFLLAMPVQELVIDNCPILERRCQNEVGEDWHLISRIQNFKIKNSSG